MKRIHVALAVACFAAGAAALPVSAATNAIQVGNGLQLVFIPASTNIAQGDTVIWTWSGSGHSTTSDTAIWDSGTTNAPYKYTNSFPNAGTFPYHCILHAGFGMVGTIVVNPVAGPPTVTVTNPVNGETFSAPATFQLAAAASESGAGVTNVQFFQNSTSLGNVTSSPYSVTVNSLATGDYTMSAVASGSTGLKATNSVLVHVVTPLPITLSGMQRLSASSFQFKYSANIGLNYVVQRSTNLFEWSSLNTNMAASNPETFLDNAATVNPAFYRVGRLPNP